MIRTAVAASRDSLSAHAGANLQPEGGELATSGLCERLVVLSRFNSGSSVTGGERVAGESIKAVGFRRP